MALVSFLWGMSLLLQEALRTRWFEPHGLSSTLVAAPLFAVAVAAALLASRARSAGRPAHGGPSVHRFGLASGLVGATALLLSLYMGPRLHALQEDARRLRARQQLSRLALALHVHHNQHGTYPEGSGVAALAALEPEFSEALPLTDPWDNPIEYRSLASGRGYLLLSLGRDGEADLPLSNYVENPDAFRGGDDLVVVNGAFRGAAAPAAAVRAIHDASATAPADPAALEVGPQDAAAGQEPGSEATSDAGSPESAPTTETETASGVGEPSATLPSAALPVATPPAVAPPAGTRGSTPPGARPADVPAARRQPAPAPLKREPVPTAPPPPPPQWDSTRPGPSESP